MENASKALLIAGAVLIGILVASLGVFLSEKISDFTTKTYRELQEHKRTEFNQQFLKYNKHLVMDYATRTMIESTINIQDIVTIINLAKDSNRKNDLEEYDNLDDATNIDDILNDGAFYVKVKFDNDTYDLGKAGFLNSDERNKLEKLDKEKINEMIKLEMDKTVLGTFSCEVYLNNNTQYVSYIIIR